MTDKMPPATRRTVASLGGTARAQGDPAELAAARGAGGSAANRPASLARRIAKQWKGLSRAERAEVREILSAGGVIPR